MRYGLARLVTGELACQKFCVILAASLRRTHLPFGEDIIAKKKSFLQIQNNLRTDQNPAID